MFKKTTASAFLTILILIFVVAIGATFSAFKVSKEKVSVESIKVITANGITITDKDGETINELKIKSSSVGVRPATGEEDSETSIPTTVNDAVGTEGAYATFKLTASSNWEIILKECSLTAGEKENLENVRIGVMEEKNKPISGTDLGSVIARGVSETDKEISVVVWLDADTTKTIKGAKINITLEIITK